MKILVSDFDHTFFNLKFEENIKAVNDFVERGNIFVIATGRNLPLLKEEIEFFDVKYSYLICKDGGIIFDNKENELFRQNINQEVVKPIYNILSKDKCIHEVLIDTGTGFTVDTTSQANSIIAKQLDHEKANTLLNEILEKFPEIDGYVSENWINITDINVSKGNAIKKLISIIGCQASDVYTIGDGINDVSMNAIFNGYAMENSVEELKSVSVDTVKSYKDFVNSL